ncbi:ABC transporter permease [Subtercola boreus]|uniref:ABC transporter permease n=1 Tax=Subtercola boreus TaxID=120213 RepID=A0A3E0VU46_9MICO|nr:sugar ABC transporter permease [Subtercola boreus]RFA13125.1 ABC transporter permease [Subtercola boreus]
MVLTTEKPEAAPMRAASGPNRVKPSAKKRPKGWWLPFALIAPAIVFELLIHVIPMVVGIWMSFIKLTQFYIANWSAAPFVGLGNYQIAVNFDGAQGQALLSSFLITCGFTVLVVGLSWGLGMAAAVALQKAFRGRAIFRTMFLIPYAVPMYAGIITWKFMFQQNTGVINQILGSLHLIDPNNPPFWLIGNNAFGAMVIVAIWKLWPFAFLMLMAGLQTINEDLYEAASLDGAKPFRQWRNITLPGLGAVNNVLLLVLFLWTFNDFNTPFILFGGGEPPAGDLISFHIYNTSFITLNFGFGAAMSVLLLLFLMLVSAIYLVSINRRSRRA